MCTYTTHIRICARCAHEDTVLISEQLCLVAKASGIFGSCLEGILCQRDVTGCLCWQCKDVSGLVRVVGAGVAAGKNLRRMSAVRRAAGRRRGSVSVNGVMA
jgi:hypothetical protein